jgi:predicted phage terminase large subunit-like protein
VSSSAQRDLSGLASPVESPDDAFLRAFLELADPPPPPLLTGGTGLLDFIPRLTPGYQPPRHLAPLVEVLQRCHRERVRAVCHAPPRHGKTETVEHAVVWYLLQNPKIVCGYATYGANLSYMKSRDMRALARRAGIELAPDAQGVEQWRTRQNGGLLATGVGGPFTGFGVNILFVDDPIKNRIEAESARKRENLMDWWRDVARTRLEPGASVIVFATRWHPDDLSGELIRQGWQYIRLPAIADTAEYGRDVGQALWPSRYDEVEHAQTRRDVGEYTWASLYQGLPRPRGGTVFHAEPALYSARALAEILKRPTGWRKGIGADFAYTKKTSADHSALVLGLGFAEGKSRYTYILEVDRAQLEAPEIAKRGKGLQERHGGGQRCPALSYVSTTEKAVAQLMAGHGFKVEARLAVGDKFTRAQPYAASWNDKRVVLPEDVAGDSWINVFLAEHLGFTGSDDKEDDQVDAGAALHDLLARAPTSPIRPPAVQTFDPDNLPGLG